MDQQHFLVTISINERTGIIAAATLDVEARHASHRLLAIECEWDQWNVSSAKVCINCHYRFSYRFKFK
jgi:hypothetical protein